MVEFEKIIGYTFKNPLLLEEALMHTSYGVTRFELFEFLGDRVLGLVVAHLLVIESDKNEIKQVASTFAGSVSAQCLINIAKKWKVEKYLKHSIQSLSNKVLVDAVEAVIGAVYIDGGYPCSYDFIKPIWADVIKGNMIEPKMFLQEYSQAKNCGLPIYKEISVQGVVHNPIYKISVEIETKGMATGVGASKHEASKQAAKNLLNKLKNEGKV